MFRYWDEESKGTRADDETDFQATQQKLLRSAANGDVDGATASLREGALVNAKCGNYGTTALHIASFFGHPNVVEVLLENGAQVNLKDSLGRTALFHAAFAGNSDCLKLLLTALGDSNIQIDESVELDEIVAPDQIDGTEPKLLEILQSLNDYSELLPKPDMKDTPFHAAIQRQNIECMQLLMMYGADVNGPSTNGYTPLVLCGIQPEIYDDQWVRRYEELVNILIRSKAKVNDYSNIKLVSPLFMSIRNKAANATRYLLNAGADVSHLGPGGETVLHVAVTAENPSILQMLLENSLCRHFVNKFDANSTTPVHLAAESGDEIILKLLLMHNGDLSIARNNRETGISLLFKNFQRPDRLLIDAMDAFIMYDSNTKNSLEFKVKLNFNMIAPNHASPTHFMLNVLCYKRSEKLLLYIFQHPLLAIFVHFKWQKYKYFFYLHFFLYTVYVLSFSGYVFLEFYDFDGDMTNHTHEIKLEKDTLIKASNICRLTIQFLVLFVGLYISLLIIIVPKLHQGEYEYWLLLIGLSFSTYVIQQDFRENTEGLVVHLSSISVLLAWIEIMLLMGRFSFLGHYGLIFSKVLAGVLKVSGAFSCLLIGFAFSFFVLFADEESFKDPYHAFVETVVMAIGEYEYERLFQNKRNHIRISTRIIFIAFIILVSIALMNLMIGMAVVDVQELEELTHIDTIVKKATFITGVEEIGYKIKCLCPGFLRRIMTCMQVPNEIVTYPTLAEKGMEKITKRTHPSSDLPPITTLPYDLKMSVVKIIDSIKLEERVRLSPSFLELTEIADFGKYKKLDTLTQLLSTAELVYTIDQLPYVVLVITQDLEAIIQLLKKTKSLTKSKTHVNILKRARSNDNELCRRINVVLTELGWSREMIPNLEKQEDTYCSL